jgi:hypothetical protein
LETNNITGQAMTEIYPTPAQLPPFLTHDPVDGPVNSTNYWRPLAMSSYYSIDGNTHNGHGFQGDGESWMTFLIASHLSGTNSVDKPIIWPAFPGANGTNFLGKYSLLQLDSLATQITDEVGKALVPEAYDVFGAGGMTYTLGVATQPWGLLSHEPVLGLGRSAKINEIYISAQAFGAVTNGSSYTAPYLNMAIYLETYLPAGFAGVDLLNAKPATGLPPAKTYPQYIWGASGASSGDNARVQDINIEDFPTNVTVVATNTPPYAPANSPTVRSATTGDIMSVGTTINYWADSILRNDQGIDFLGNPSGYADPDQARAVAYHSYLTNSASQPSYGGTNYPGNGVYPGQISPLFQMGGLAVGGLSGTNIWYPGQYRTVNNNAGFVTNAFYMTNVNSGTTLHITGGLIVTGACANGAGDPDPTPLEAAVKASVSPTTRLANLDDYDGQEINSGNYWTQVALSGNSNQTSQPSNPNETVRDRLVNGAIPVNITLNVPAASASSLTPGGANVTYDVAVADPLVNKFPADWVASTNTAPTMGGAGGSPPTMYPTGFGGYAVYYNGQNTLATGPTANSPYYDPDSFWMPTLDPKIPRSARFPNIGYLNYLRTGVFPDNETVPIGQQHGTPYRCLNFNAASDASQTLAVAGTVKTSYPDWALLDLFTIPSTLLPYGGPYGYYKYPNGTNVGTATWTAGALFAGNPTNMYYYGTWGGSTPGRINPNGAVVYTTNANVPTPGITRLLPLEALTTNIMVNQTIPNGSGTTPPAQLTNAPTFTGGAAVNASNIASAIATYLQTNTYGVSGGPAPLREPAEICNLLGGYTAVNGNPGGDSAHNNPTRNDLVRQIVGNLTTQSNTFSVWVEGQTITKSKANNVNYGIYESGDQITGSVRYHFVIERYLQAGAGGVYGNTQNPLEHYSTVGTNAYPSITPPSGVNFTYTNTVGDVDGIVGTYDDPADPAYHPVNPRYLYRVVYAEEIRD